MDAVANSMTSPAFWVGVSFVVFVALVFQLIYRFICSRLDARTERIREELDEAVHLREEAQALLANYQRKQRDTLQEAEDILASARREADKMTELAMQDLETALNRRIELAMQKISQAEASAVQDVQHNLVDIAIAAAYQVIREEAADGDLRERIEQDALRDIESKLDQTPHARSASAA